jgi:hypothetical protein
MGVAVPRAVLRLEWCWVCNILAGKVATTADVAALGYVHWERSVHTITGRFCVVCAVTGM